MRLRLAGIVLIAGVLFASDALRANGNGFVCAYDLRGTRAYNTDPYFDFTWFGISDDKIRK